MAKRSAGTQGAAGRTEERDEATEEEKREWPTRATVARRLGLTVQGVKSLEARDELHPIFLDGCNRFDPAEVAILERQRNGGHSVTAQLDLALDMLKQSHKHNERLIELIVNPRHEILRVFLSNQRQIGTEVGRLRRKNFAMLEAHEKVLDQESDRKLAEADFERTQKRRDEAMAAALPFLPKLFNQLIAGLLVNKKTKPLTELISSLSDEQIEVLETSGFLNEHQKKALLDVRAGLLPAPKPPAKVEPETETKKTA